MQQKLYGEELVFNAKKDSGHEFEFTLPEYLPNISRIVKTFAFVENAEVNNDGEMIFGLKLKIGIVYVSDFGGKIKSAVFHENLSIPMGEGFTKGDSTVIIPSAYVLSAVSKTTGTRKFVCTCNCVLNICAYEQTEKIMLADSEEEKIHTLREKKFLCRKITLPEAEFDEDVQISLELSGKNIGEIIYTDAVFCGAECRINGSQLVFEGQFNLHTLYETDDENDAQTTYAVINAPVTVKESVESSLLKDGQRAFIYLDVLSAEPSVSFDPYGENKVISLSLKYKASAVVFEGYDAEIVTDAFSEECAKEPETTEVYLDSIKSSISTTVKLSETIKGDIRDLSEISDCSAKILSVSMEHSRDKLFALAKCRVSIFGTNGQGELTSRDNIIVLHIPILAEGTAFGIVPEIVLSIVSCKAFVHEGNIVVEPEIAVKGIICERKSMDVVTGLCKEGARTQLRAKNEIIICYPGKGDTIWSIAKKYSACPDALQKANNLENGDISSKRTLLIP